jgi:hypothetical protein
VSTRIDELVRYELELGGGLTNDAQEAARAIRGLGQAAQSSGREFDAMERGAGKIASMLGGPFADLGDVVLDLGPALEGASGAIGLVGTVAAGSALALTAVVIGSKALADAAVAARDRLVDAGLAAEIPAASLESLDHYQRSQRDLQASLDLLVVRLGGPVAEALSEATYATIGLGDAFAAVSQKTSPLYAGLSELGSALSWLSPARIEFELLAAAAGYFADAGKQAAAAVNADNGLGSFLRKESETRIDGLSERMAAKEEQIRLEKAAAAAAASARKQAEAEAMAENQRRMREALAANERSLEQDRAAAAEMRDSSPWTSLPMDMSRLALDGGKVFADHIISAMAVNFPAIIEDAFAPALEAVKRAASEAMAARVQTVTQFAALSDDLSTALGQLGQMLPGMLGAVASFASVVVDAERVHQVSVSLVEQLGNWIRDFPDLTVTMMTEMLPEITGAIAKLPLALIQAAIEFPAALIRSIPGMITGILRELGDALNPFNDSTGGVSNGRFAASPGALAGGRGGPAPSRAVTTQARQIGRAESARGMRARSGGSVGEIHVHGVTDARQFAGELRRTLGEWQLGDSLGAY